MTFIYSDYPERSWSFSKYNLFSHCKRKYYYNFYGSWNGWMDNCSKERRHTYLLKKLEDVYTLSGNYLHGLIKSVIGGQSLTQEEIYNEVMKRLNQVCLDSRTKINQWKQHPNKFTVLNDYYYSGNLPTDLVEEIKDRTKECSINLYKAITFRDINNAEIIENDDGEFVYFMFENIKVNVKIDLMYKKEDQVILVDWKTGYPEEENHRLQMLVYYLYVKEKYKNLKIDLVKCVDEYLLLGERYSDIFVKQDLEEIENFIRSSIKDMDTYLEDVEHNKPQSVEYFPATKSGLCNRCNFREIC